MCSFLAQHWKMISLESQELCECWQGKEGGEKLRSRRGAGVPVVPVAPVTTPDTARLLLLLVLAVFTSGDLGGGSVRLAVRLAGKLESKSEGSL